MINIVYRLLIEYAAIVLIATHKHSFTRRLTNKKENNNNAGAQAVLRSQLDVK